MEFARPIEEFCRENRIENKKFVVDGFDLGFKVESTDLITLIKFLKSSPELRFTVLTDLFGADFPERERRFEVVYSLLSLKLNKRIIIKLGANEDEKVPSITNQHPAACWYEREAFDMFGIEFSDAPDLRRILTDYGFKGHPLRKDFPVTGHVQVKYDEDLEKVIYEPVLLEQEFRNFDFTSPWQGGKNHVLPGDEKATQK